ncbi:MAG: hypothetical protein PHV18_01910 [Lachnospiraceae bacterium]|nr:hypothetical protein [Lachnospiraceae bacterium]
MKISDFLQAIVTFQDGSSHLYKVPTMKVQTFTLQEIKEKHLTFLIPFVPLRFRNRLYSEKNAVKSEELTSFYDEIMVMLNQEVENGYLSETQRTMVVSLLRKSMIRVFYRDESLVKEVLRLTEPIRKFEWEDLEKELQEERKRNKEELQEERERNEAERQLKDAEIERLKARIRELEEKQ